MFQEVCTGLLSEGYEVRFGASGESMHPTIRDGEMLTVVPVKARRVKRGDIILYRSGRGLTAHRVIRIERTELHERAFILRGDNCTTCDAPVQAAQILGRAVFVERGGREIALKGLRARLRRLLSSRLAQLKDLVKMISTAQYDSADT